MGGEQNYRGVLKNGTTPLLTGPFSGCGLERVPKIAEYVNFGIKGSTVKQFLSAHDIPTKWSNRQKEIKSKDIYKIASKQTVMVVCHRE